MELSKDELNAALEKVSYMFPSPAGGTADDPVGGNDAQARKNAPKYGRARVDSQARPPEFVRNIRPQAPARLPVNYHEFSVHGVHEPVLRQRLESKAIDVATLNRVQIEFQTHDKLSAQELSHLSLLAEQAHQLHKDHDVNGAEKLYEQVPEIFNLTGFFLVTNFLHRFWRPTQSTSIASTISASFCMPRVRPSARGTSSIEHWWCGRSVKRRCIIWRACFTT